MTDIAKIIDKPLSLSERDIHHLEGRTREIGKLSLTIEIDRLMNLPVQERKHALRQLIQQKKK